MSSIILASESFLKKFIFDKSKLPYETKPAYVDETAYDNLPVSERVAKLAESKAGKIAETNPDATIISADTLTSDADGNVYNKLSHANDPFLAALSLSGKTIYIYTGCCVYDKVTGYNTKTIKSSITYRTFSQKMLQRLIEGDNAAIRSGALGIFYDSPGFTLIEQIEGSYTGSFGLPMEFVYEQLDRLEHTI